VADVIPSSPLAVDFADDPDSYGDQDEVKKHSIGLVFDRDFSYHSSANIEKAITGIRRREKLKSGFEK
jgi:hypothetical protein